MKSNAFLSSGISLLAAAAALSLAPRAGAATLQIDSGSSAGFGRIGGAYVAFSSSVSSTVETNWGGAPPVDGSTYSIDSISFVKNNPTGEGFSELWIGVYGSYSGTANPGGSAGVFGDFLGVSSASVAWSTFNTGSTVTWTFDGITATASSGQTLYFAFQTSAASLAGEAPLIATEGQTSVRRLPGDGNNFDNQGAAMIEAMLAVPVGSEGYLRDNRVPFINLETTLIPEPSSSALLGLGALALLRRKRNG